jgi:hypothetical protein
LSVTVIWFGPSTVTFPPSPVVTVWLHPATNPRALKIKTKAKVLTDICFLWSTSYCLTMPDAFEDQAWVKMGVAAALAQQYESDQRPLLQLLANSFEKAFPGQVKTKTKGLFGGKHIVSLEIAVDEYVYTIDDPGSGSLVATRKKLVRGIALKTEYIPMQACLEELAQELEIRAKSSSETHKALSESLGLIP